MGKPALEQGGEIFAREPKTFAERPFLHRRYGEQAREDVGVKVAISYNYGIGDAASHKQPVCHRPAVGMVA